MDAFEVFKIIIGIVIGVFILFFMLNFTGLYSTYQQESIEVTHLKNFKRVLQDVYLSDTPAVFRMKIDTDYNPPKISLYTKAGNVLDTRIPVPFFYKTAEKDKDVIGYSGFVDHGFTKFKFAGVFPAKNFFFNIVPFSNQSFGIVSSLTQILPGAEDPPMFYGFCFNDDDYLFYPQPSKTGFLNDVNQIIEYTSKIDPNWKPKDKKIDFCTKQRDANDIIITVTDQENFPENGFLVKPDGRLGKVFFKESTQPRALIYKDELDVLAAIAGGEQAYKYKNTEQMTFLEIAAKSEIERANNLAFAFQNSKPLCSSLFEDAKSVLTKFKDSVGKMKTKFNDMSTVVEYSDLENQVKEKYKELESQNCV